MAEVLIPGIHDPDWHIDITCSGLGTISGCGGLLRARRADIFIHRPGGVANWLACCHCDSCGTIALVSNRIDIYRSAGVPDISEWCEANPDKVAYYETLASKVLASRKTG